MKSLVFIAIFFTGTIFCSAQQEGQFMQMVNNPYLLNPAAGGMTKVVQLELGIRNQWMGYAHGPQSYILSGHSRIKVGENNVLEEYAPSKASFFKSPSITGREIKHVVGGMMLNETIGPFNRLNLQGSYAVHMPLYKDITIGAGLSAGFSSFGIIQDRVILYDQDDNYMQFLGSSVGQNIFNMNGGLIVYHPKFMVGFSTLQMLNNDVVFSGTETESKFNRHYYLMANYGFALNSSPIEIRPTIITKFAQNTPLNVNAALKLTYNDAIWAMAGYRTSGSLTFQIGANLVKQIYLSYGYEHGIGKLQVQGNGTHEVHIGYYIGRKRNIAKELKSKETE